MEPVVDGLRAEYDGRVDFVVFKNVNDDPDGATLARTHGVTAVPTMMLVDPDGSERQRWVGARPVDELRAAFVRDMAP